MTSTAAVAPPMGDEPTTALVPAPQQQRKLTMLRPIAEPGEIIQVQNETRALVRKTLVEDRDYGLIPGTKKKSLLKPGAERVAAGFGCMYGDPVIVEHEIDHDRRVEWRKPKGGDGISFGLYRYVLKVPVIHLESGRIVGWGAGACSTMEAKYIDRPRDMENTVFKMAAKRARIDGCLTTFGLSDEFTQDMEDQQEENDEQEQAPVLTRDSEVTWGTKLVGTKIRDLPDKVLVWGLQPDRDLGPHTEVWQAAFRAEIEHRKTAEVATAADAAVKEIDAATARVRSHAEGEQRPDPTASSTPNTTASSSENTARTGSASSTSAAAADSSPYAGDSELAADNRKQLNLPEPSPVRRRS